MERLPRPGRWRTGVRNGVECCCRWRRYFTKIINDHEFAYHNAHCFRVKIFEKLGPAQAIYYDVAALHESCEIIKRDKIPHPIVYIMACRIGPFMKHYYHKIHKLGGKIYLNPDGHEFKRAKWNRTIRKYWKLSEQMMVKWSDLVICDSKTIEQYIHECYDGKGIKGRSPKTTFIAYGAETRKSKLADDDKMLLDWYVKKWWDTAYQCQGLASWPDG
ncbi:MAG TPA: DUF1972 domain-containing protein [Candidatus Pullilachnospira intestinigallinarum]|nr:DUF1972 domain-containing protein [Candidatus Pullilachnospira intestinigallinarum]